MGLKKLLNEVKYANYHLSKQINKTKDEEFKKALKKRLKENERFERLFGHVEW